MSQNIMENIGGIEIPTIKLGQYKGVEVEKVQAEFKEEFLTAEIEAMLNSKSSLVDAEEGHKAEMGDTVDLAFDGSIDGIPFDGGKADSHQLTLGSKMFIDTFEDQLVGYAVGQEGEVHVTFPAEYGHAPLAGKPAVFKVKINSIKKLVKAELTEELATEFGFTSVEDLMLKKTAEIMAREEQAAKNQTIGRLIQKITDGTEATIPHFLVEKEFEYKVKEMEQHLSMQGANLEMYLNMLGKTFEQMEEDMMPMCHAKVKADLLLEEIAKVEGLTITDEEMNARMTEIGVMYGMDLAKLEEELTKVNNLEAFKFNINVELILDKAVSFVFSHAKLI